MRGNYHRTIDAAILWTRSVICKYQSKSKQTIMVSCVSCNISVAHTISPRWQWVNQATFISPILFPGNEREGDYEITSLSHWEISDTPVISCYGRYYQENVICSLLPGKRYLFVICIIVSVIEQLQILLSSNMSTV